MATDLLDVPNIGTRVFRRPGPTIRSAKTGDVVPPEKLARNLVAVAVLEHAVTNGAKVDEVLCAGCRVPVKVKGKGRPAVRCVMCSVQKNRDDARAAYTPKGSPRTRKMVTLDVAVARHAAKAKGQRERSARAREERVAAGLCVSCGKAPMWNGTRRCEGCRAKRSAKS